MVTDGHSVPSPFIYCLIYVSFRISKMKYRKPFGTLLFSTKIIFVNNV